MTVQSIRQGTPVELEFAGHTLPGVIEDIRWKPSFGNVQEEIVVDANGTRIATGRASIRPR